MRRGCGSGSPTSSSRRSCDPVDAAFAIAADEFAPLLVERELARDAGRGWQLDRLAAVSDLIRCGGPGTHRVRAARRHVGLG